MSWTELVYWVGDIIYASFAIIEGLAWNADIGIMVIGIIMMLWWIRKMIAFDKEADAAGTYR